MLDLLGCHRLASLYGEDGVIHYRTHEDLRKARAPFIPLVQATAIVRSLLQAPA